MSVNGERKERLGIGNGDFIMSTIIYKRRLKLNTHQENINKEREIDGLWLRRLIG